MGVIFWGPQMLSARKKKDTKKEIPLWRRQMMEHEEEPSGNVEGSLKRPREEEDRGSTSHAVVTPKVDTLLRADDADEDVDLSAYDLGGDDDADEEDQISAAPARQPTREDLLLMREAKYSAGRSTKTYFVDDHMRSIEKSAGSERKLDALKLKKMLAQGKI